MQKLNQSLILIANPLLDTLGTKLVFLSSSYPFGVSSLLTEKEKKYTCIHTFVLICFLCWKFQTFSQRLLRIPHSEVLSSPWSELGSHRRSWPTNVLPCVTVAKGCDFYFAKPKALGRLLQPKLSLASSKDIFQVSGNLTRYSLVGFFTPEFLTKNSCQSSRHSKFVSGLLFARGRETATPMCPGLKRVHLG